MILHLLSDHLSDRGESDHLSDRGESDHQESGSHGHCWQLDPAESHVWLNKNSCSSVAALPGGWCYQVSARTGWPGVSNNRSDLQLLSVTARTTV